MPTRLLFSVICVAAAAAASACAVRVRPGGAVYVHPAPVYVAPAPPPPRRVYVASAPPPAYPAQPPPAYPAQPPQPAPVGYQQPPPAQPPMACVDPAERDISDRFEQAMPIGPGATVGCIYRGDTDLFIVTAPAGNAGHVLTFALRGAHEMAPSIQVLDFNRRGLHRHSAGTSQEVRGWVQSWRTAKIVSSIAASRARSGRYSYP